MNETTFSVTVEVGEPHPTISELPELMQFVQTCCEKKGHKAMKKTKKPPCALGQECRKSPYCRPGCCPVDEMPTIGKAIKRSVCKNGIWR